jgi:S1-C subfamily serine protease
MKLRTLFIALLLVVGFIYWTTTPNSPFRHDSSGPLWSGPGVTHSAGLGSDEQNNIDIYKAAKDSVAYITSTVLQRTFFFEVVPTRALGSGFVINSDGQILTNNHVISGSSKVEVTLPDQSRYTAKVLVRDAADDLALIQIEPKKKLSYLRLGESDSLQVGQKVLAIGNPFGFAGTLTTGVVSSLGRDIQSENNKLEGMVQTDAAINEGNSGGPLLDSQGSVIGINTAIYGPNGANVGIGFATPINRAKTMLEGFRTGKNFGRPRLGVSTVYIAGDLAEELKLPATGGLLVQEIGNGSAAATAGLHGYQSVVVVGNQRLGIGGDLITSIDGKAVTEPDAVTRTLAKKHPGDIIALKVFRGGRTIDVQVKLGEAPEDAF